MYRVYLCDYDTGEEKLVYSSESFASCCNEKQKMINRSISRGERYDKTGRVRKTYLIAGEEGTRFLQTLLWKRSFIFERRLP